MEYPMLHNAKDIRDTYLWLGGTATEDWDWRKELIPYLDNGISYYDPCIRPGDGLEWDETARANELKAKEYARCHVYVITSGMKGCFSIEEITESIMSRPQEHRKDVCVAVLDYKNSFSPEMKKSLQACVERWEALGATITNTLMNVAVIVNKHYHEHHPSIHDFVGPNVIAKISPHF